MITASLRKIHHGNKNVMLDKMENCSFRYVFPSYRCVRVLFVVRVSISMWVCASVHTTGARKNYSCRCIKMTETLEIYGQNEVDGKMKEGLKYRKYLSATESNNFLVIYRGTDCREERPKKTHIHKALTRRRREKCQGKL